MDAAKDTSEVPLVVTLGALTPQPISAAPIASSRGRKWCCQCCYDISTLKIGALAVITLGSCFGMYYSPLTEGSRYIFSILAAGGAYQLWNNAIPNYLAYQTYVNSFATQFATDYRTIATDLQVLRRLKREGHDLSRLDENGHDILQHAFDSNSIPVLIELLEHFPIGSDNWRSIVQFLSNPPILSLRDYSYYSKVINILKRQSVLVPECVQVMMLTKNQTLRALDFYIKCGFNINAKDHRGDTILLRSLTSVDKPLLKKYIENLITKGADPKCTAHAEGIEYSFIDEMGAQSPLHRYLIERLPAAMEGAAKIHHQVPINNAKAFQNASVPSDVFMNRFSSNFDNVRALYEMGGDLNKVDSSGLTLSDYANRKYQPDMIVEFYSMFQNKKDKAIGLINYCLNHEKLCPASLEFLRSMIAPHVNLIPKELQIHLLNKAVNQDQHYFLVSCGIDLSLREKIYADRYLEVAVPSSELLKYLANNMASIMMLIEQEADVTKADENGLTIFDYAVRGNRLQIVQALLVKYPPKPSESAQFIITNCLRGRPSEELLKFFQSSGLVSPMNCTPADQVMIWESVRHEKDIDFLQKCGFDINVKDDKGETLLMRVVKSSQYYEFLGAIKPMVRLKSLILHGADPLRTVEVDGVEKSVLDIAKELNPRLYEELSKFLSEMNA